MKYFPNLHSHTGMGSLGDGFGVPDLWIKELKKRGITDHVITDHGTLTAVPMFFKAGQAEGINFYPGMEGYIIPELDGYNVTKEDGVITDNKTKTKVLHYPFRHIVLIPMNEMGWRNLIKINNIAWRNGRFRNRGRFGLDTLLAYNEGLIVLSACIQGIFSYPFTQFYLGQLDENITIEDVRNEVDELVEIMLNIFGDRLYIELMIFQAKIQHKVNKELVRIINKYGIEPVLTNDAHYPDPKYASFRETLRYVAVNKDDADNKDKDFSVPELYPRSLEDIVKVWKQYKYDDFIDKKMLKRAYKNTFKIIKRIEFKLDNAIKLPYFDVKSHPYYDKAMRADLATLTDQPNEKLFMFLIAKGYKRRLGKKFPIKYWDALVAGKKLKNNNKYLKQVLYEYKVIQNAGFVDYFLIVEDIIRYCVYTRKKIYGEGRGSVAGSVISWFMGISKDNPFKYGLIFERFINAGRLAGELPDIDMDFPPSIRDDIKEYIANKYGYNKVCSIGTVNTISVKSAIQKVAAAHEYKIDGIEYDFHKIQKITHTIPLAVGGGASVKTLEDAVNVCKSMKDNEFYKFYQKHQDWLEKNIPILSGHPITYGRHAAGVIISPYDVDESIPIRVIEDKGTTTVVSQWRDKDLLPMGFLKLDILGLNTLDQIDYANKLIKERHPKQHIPSMGEFNKNDARLYSRVLRKGQTTGIFQLNSPMFKRYLQELRPKNFEHIYNTTALLRPGPMGVNAHKTYIELVHGNKKPEYVHPDEEPILGETGGLVIFQEQAMKLCTDIAGFTLEEADVFRSVVGKKKRDKMPEQKRKFIEGAVKRGYSQKVAEKIFAKIESFLGYGFNKSHAVAYTGISMYQVWQKAYYPLEYWASKLQYASTNLDNSESAWNLRRRILGEGYEIAPIDVNTCGSKIKIDDDGRLVWRLDLIHGVGTVPSELIEKFRPYSGPIDMMNKIVKVYSELKSKDSSLPRVCPINKRVIVNLITAGAFHVKDKTVYDIAAEYLVYYYKSKNKKQAELIQMFIDNDVDIPTLIQEYNAPKALISDLEWLSKLNTVVGYLQLQNDVLHFVSKPYWELFKSFDDTIEEGYTVLDIENSKVNDEVIVYGLINNITFRRPTSQRANFRKGPKQFITGSILEYDGDVEFNIFGDDFLKLKTKMRDLSKRLPVFGYIKGVVKYSNFNQRNVVLLSDIEIYSEEQYAKAKII